MVPFRSCIMSLYCFLTTRWWMKLFIVSMASFSSFHILEWLLVSLMCWLIPSPSICEIIHATFPDLVVNEHNFITNSSSSFSHCFLIALFIMPGNGRVATGCISLPSTIFQLPSVMRAILTAFSHTENVSIISLGILLMSIFSCYIRGYRATGLITCRK